MEREFVEELGTPAVAHPTFGPDPVMITVTRTRDPHGVGGQHLDVSLWHVLLTDRAEVREFDQNEFAAIGWYSPQALMRMPVQRLDPHMHRFIGKYLTGSEIG